MPIVDVRSSAGALLPAEQPNRRSQAQTESPPYMILPTHDQGTNIPIDVNTDLVSLWTARQRQWHSVFEQVMSSRIREYWGIWRAFDQGPMPGPGQEWRDRTVMPQAFKELASRVPRIALGMFGQVENFTVEGRGYKDDDYEERVRTLIEQSIDGIGLGDPQNELFIKRFFDGTFYQQIMGHVFWKVFWRNESHWYRTQRPEMDEEGKIKSWEPWEKLETIYDNIDLQWVPLTQLAIDMYGKRRWCIERVRTSLESLKGESERFQEAHGRPLYPKVTMESLELQQLGAQTNDQMDEPRDTEGWPMDSESVLSHDPGETPVELWLCYDNVKRTLTKICNRRIVLDHGQADTPDGLDPYISDPAIPVPGRPYGDSIFNWTKSLYTRQTRLARARMDETLLNIFQQYLVREGSLKGSVWFWRPGGISTVQQANNERPLSDNIYQVPRRPMPVEAYNEEAHAQQQSEAVAGADSLSQGVESTQKSRDVTAAEVNQRVMQGGSRYQMEILYHESTFKRPFLQKCFDLLRQNLTQERMVRILDDTEGTMMDLRQLERPIDIKVGGATMDVTLAETMAELEKVTNVIKDPNMAAVFKHRELAVEMIKATRSLKKKARKIVKSEEDIAKEQAQALAMEQQQAQAAMAPDATGQEAPGVQPGNEIAGGPGAAGLAGGNGAGPVDPASAASDASFEI